MLNKKVQIVATGMRWQEHDVGEETWALLKAFIKGARADRIYSMDGFNIELIKSGEADLDGLKGKIGSIPFITNKNFPREKMEKEFGTTYATNTVCYMIAQAIMEGYEEIDLFGVNQAGLFEYMEQRRGVEFWMGVAIGRGIDVTVNEPTALLKSKGDHYGYESEGMKTERKAKGSIKKILDLVGYVQGYKE